MKICLDFPILEMIVVLLVRDYPMCKPASPPRSGLYLDKFSLQFNTEQLICKDGFPSMLSCSIEV